MAVHRGGLQLVGLQAFRHREYVTTSLAMSLLGTWRTGIQRYAEQRHRDEDIIRHPAICAVIAGDVVPVSDCMEIFVKYAHFRKLALRLAIELNHVSVVRILLGAHPEIPDATARRCFTMAKNEEILRMLFEYITDTVKTLWGTVYWNNVPATRLLLSLGTPCDDILCGDTILHVAVRQGYTALVELIVAHTTNVDIRNTRNHTALYYANSVPIAKILLDAGANLFPHRSPSIVDKVGRTPDTVDIAELVLTYACTCKRTEEDIAIFISKGKCTCTWMASAYCLVFQCARRLRSLRRESSILGR